ncbi:MAG: hypothetical protein NWE83_05605 [Candidatus Bathyarchaeota archaeon]|nr:hypothetical protein [Candidatus Bathyarchaeota archaeon]
MKIEKTILCSLLLGIVLTFVLTLRFETEIIPDSTVTRHGHPFFWLHHQTSSIAGAVNIWSVQWAFLVIDFALWFIISAVIVYVVDRYRK